MKRFLFFVALLVVWVMLPPKSVSAQGQGSQTFSLEQCLQYALTNQPQIRRSLIEESIGEREIRANLSGWMPQVTAQYVLNHNIKRQQSVFGDNVITIGTRFTSNVLLEANQTLYSNELALASRAARYSRLQLDQVTEEARISTVVEVSKAFYDVLLTQEQLRILDENIARQEKQYQDALARYESGLVDKTDYQRASITLANSRSDRKRTQEGIKARYARLKQLMGFPAESDLNLAFDNAAMQEQMHVDTTQVVTFQNRVELRQLQTQQQLLQLNTRYFRTGFIPTLSAYATYSPLFFSNTLGTLYDTMYPTSTVGLQAAIPIFQGTRRVQNVKIAQLQEERLTVDIENTRNLINTEYQTALANYKGDYNEWLTLRENAQVAEEVYNTIKLQYDEGIKAYIDLVVAETDLKAAQLNYYNALFRVLSSKLDLDRALGVVQIN